MTFSPRNESEALKLARLRSTLYIRTAKLPPNEYKFTDPQMVRDFLPIQLSGGIGDLLLAIPVIEELKREVGPVLVYTRYDEIWAKFSNIPVKHWNEFKGYDYWLHMNHVPFFVYEKHFRGYAPQHVEFAKRWEKKASPWLPLTNHHPYLDNEIGNRAVELGLTRRTLPYYILGLYPKDWKIEIETPITYDQPFITVHDGFDGTHPFATSTKNWRIELWAQFVRLFKVRFPKLDVVQLGGPKSRPIPGAINLCNTLSFYDSVRFLHASKLHIDGESGLVHAAHAVGTKSVVLFGPTSDQYFAYSDNISIRNPHACPGNCWWLKNDWMKQCAIDFKTPKCMDEIRPETVLKAVMSVLQ